jgi:hypothetical protein
MLSSAGVLGILTALGRTSFTVSVTDGAPAAQQTYSFDVNPMHRVTTGAGADARGAIIRLQWSPAPPSSASLDPVPGGGVAAADVTRRVRPIRSSRRPSGSLAWVLTAHRRDRARVRCGREPDDGVAAGDVNADGVPDITGAAESALKGFDSGSGSCSGSSSPICRRRPPAYASRRAT